MCRSDENECENTERWENLEEWIDQLTEGPKLSAGEYVIPARATRIPLNEEDS